MLISEIGCHERARIGGKKKVNAFKDGLLILIEMISFFLYENKLFIYSISNT